MVIKPVQVYVSAMAGAAVVCALVQDWTPLTTLSMSDQFGLLSLIVLGVLSESVSVSFKVAKTDGHSSITFIPFLASVVLFGPTAAILLAGTTSFFAEFLLHRKPIVRSTFNLSQAIVNTTIAGALYTGMVSTLGLPSGNFPESFVNGLIFLPFIAFVGVLFFGNYLSVATAITLDQGLPFRQVLGGLMGSAGANFVYGILVSPLAFVVALLYDYFSLAGLLLAILPLIFIRRSYLTTLKLEKVNRDLLKALVKAIETRDPYTSGHSVRVSSLARRICLQLRLSFKKIEEIEQAALLHDIGKIDAVYSTILRKPESLSPDERAIIESHVTKGVELLQSISSFPPGVIAAVRHHHEREDGRGYPDRLQGKDIPLGAKVIKVCDAIDAMLSDRPYRDALSLPQVREQLLMYSGVQFDDRIVEKVVRTNILEEHQSEVERSKDQVSQDVPFDLGEAAPRSVGIATALTSALSLNSRSRERLKTKSQIFRQTS